MSIREERAAEVRRLYDSGLTGVEIARRLGWARGTVYALLSDPDGSRLRARKDSYRGVCECCGGQTDGSKGRAKAPTLCRECREWPEEAVIAAMQDWAERHGGVPPTMADWRPGGEDHPTPRTAVIRRVGWNELLLRAGFDLHMDRRPETQAEVERLLRAGVPTAEIAERFGCTVANIHGRVRTRGKRVSELRPAA